MSYTCQICNKEIQECDKIYINTNISLPLVFCESCVKSFVLIETKKYEELRDKETKRIQLMFGV